MIPSKNLENLHSRTTTTMQIFMFILLLLPFLIHSDKIDNECCRPRPTLVAIDNPNFKFFPYFVKLNRCGGSCDRIKPTVKSCISLQFREVPVTVQVVGTEEMTTIKERNHTQCGCECVIGFEDCNLEFEEWRPDLCQCKCKYGKKGPQKPCDNGFRWSKRHCRCVCDKEPQTCPSNKAWSPSECSCVCKDRKYRSCEKQNKIVDEKTCRCINENAPKTSEVFASQPQQKGGLRQDLYIGLFLGQFVLLYLVFDAILFRKKAGLIYRLTKSCSSDKDDCSNIDGSREDICDDSNSTTVTDIGQRNVAACGDV